MAYYRASKVIKMRRNALGHSREEYSVEGPSDRTIYRMENGKVRIKESTYRRLSRVMDEEESTKQGILQTEDMSGLWLTNEISKSLFEADYERAEELIQQIEGKLDVSIEKNRRYLSYIKDDLQYYKGDLENVKYMETIEAGLSHGNMDLVKLLERKWPFKEDECKQILNLIEVVRSEKEYEKQKELLEQLLVILDAGYIEPERNRLYQVVARYRMGDVLGNMGLHREAIMVDEETICVCEEKKVCRFLPKLYYDIFWNYLMLKEKETLTKQEEARCKECLLKAYYFGKVIYLDNTLYEQRMQECYPEELSSN